MRGGGQCASGKRRLKPADLEIPNTVVQIGLAPRRIDILTDVAVTVTGLSFNHAGKNASCIRSDCSRYRSSDALISCAANARRRY